MALLRQNATVVTITLFVALSTTVRAGEPASDTIAAASAEQGSIADARLATVAQTLAARCLECHAGDGAEAGYDMSTLESLATAGDSGQPAIVAGSAGKSELYRRLVASDESMRMPAGGPFLGAAEIDAIRGWIDAGAASDPWPADAELTEIAAALEKTPQPPAVYPRPVPIAAIASTSSAATSAAARLQHLASAFGGGAPDAATTFTGGYRELLQWNPTDGTLQRRWNGFGAFIDTIAVDGDGGRVAVAHGTPGQRGHVSLIDRTLGSDSARVDLLNVADVPADIAFSPDGRLLAVALLDGSVAVLDVVSRVPRLETVLHADAVLAVAWSADGSRLLTASRDRTARVLEVGSWRAISNYTAHERSVHGVCPVPAGAITLDESGALRLWPQQGNRPLLNRQLSDAAHIDLVSHEQLVLVPLDHQVLRTEIRWKEIDNGKDDEGKPKKRSVPEWHDWPPLNLRPGDVLTGLAVSPDGAVTAGTQSGTLYRWPRAALDRDSDALTTFTAVPR